MALIQNHTFTANAEHTFRLRSHRSATPPLYTVAVMGTFGSGTVTLTISFDGGTTYMALNDLGGSAITFSTAASYKLFQVCAGNNPIATEDVIVKAALTGATSPSLNMRVFDIT